MEIYDNKIFSILGNLFFLFEKIEITRFLNRGAFNLDFPKNQKKS